MTERIPPGLIPWWAVLGMLPLAWFLGGRTALLIVSAIVIGDTVVHFFRRPPTIWLNRGFLRVDRLLRMPRFVPLHDVRLVEPYEQGHRIHVKDGTTIEVRKPVRQVWRQFMAQVGGNVFR